ncbi:MAG: hypothetical protein V4467_04775 [Patescibacteria group bacterium]
MDPNLLTFIVGHCDDNFKGKERQILLTILRDDPERSRAWARVALRTWTIAFREKCRVAVTIGDYDESALTVVARLQQHFASEIAILPRLVPTTAPA